MADGLYTILDLDNTISNDGWRIKSINWQHAEPMRRYHAYHSLSAFDEPGNVDLFRGKSNIIILTARPTHYRALTEEWLKRNGVQYNIMIMRNDSDHCHSRDLKMKQLKWLGELYSVPPALIEHAYDDRQDVVDMYISNGVQATCRSIHDICAYTRPEGK